MDLMDDASRSKPNKEKGILKLDTSPRPSIESRYELTPQGSWERGPSVDRQSVTWADPEDSMSSPGGNPYHLPTEGDLKYSSGPGDASEDEDYSASISAVLRQRRASVRRSRKGRARRASSPFLPDDRNCRRRSSVFTTSSGDTAISMEECQSPTTQEQIFENIHLHKEVLSSVKQQPLDMKRKLKIVVQAKAYIKRHEGQLQERLAQSKSTRDIYARFNILLTSKWHQLKREAANMSNLLIPWELRIKEIESHFGSVVASYFTFLRWLFWVNLVIGFILLVFVIVPEYLTANPDEDGGRKKILDDERRNATNLLTLWEFEGVLKFSAIFYGFYSNIERSQYRMPLAYFLTGLAVYIYSFVATLRKMAENSRMSKLSEKEDECVFSWKLFTGWDFMIGNAETAHNRIASVILSFKEALLEEAEKKKDLRNWRVISLRAIVNICVVLLLAVSAFAVVNVVSRSDDNSKSHSWWHENETTIVVTIISITFPVFFELLGFLEHYHPRKQLRLQLARIMLLNLLNLYSLIFALFSKIDRMSDELHVLKPRVINETVESNETALIAIFTNCTQVEFLSDCFYCDSVAIPTNTPPTFAEANSSSSTITENQTVIPQPDNSLNGITHLKTLKRNEMENLIIQAESLISSTTTDKTLSIEEQMAIIRNMSLANETFEDDELSESNETGSEENYFFYDHSNMPIHSIANSGQGLAYDNETSTQFSPETYAVTSEMSVLTKDTTWADFSKNTDSNWINTKNTDIAWTNTYSGDITISTNSIEVESTEEKEQSAYQTDKTPMYSYTKPSEIDSDLNSSTIDLNVFYSTETVIKNINNSETVRPQVILNCTTKCNIDNITEMFVVSNCSFISKQFVIKKKKTLQDRPYESQNVVRNQTGKNSTTTEIDIAYRSKNNIIMYNLSVATKKKLLKLCWETMFGQELVKLTMMDLVFVILGTLFMDFFRALFVRYMNKCWCWDLEKKFPEYGDFKIAENILHLINNQGMVWMGMFFSPGLVVLNVFKLIIMMYLRSWTVMTCNVPHEVVFRVSKSNNFYLGLLLTMLFLCVLPVGYSIVWVKPSWHCGPFSEYDKIYYIVTKKIYEILPNSLNFTLEYIASPAIVIPLLVLLILIIYYLISLTNSLREANNDLKIQLRRERTEERRKVFQIADTRHRVGSSEMDTTPFGRWKKALPSLPLSKSTDSDDRKPNSAQEGPEQKVKIRKKGGIFAKIVNIALDRKSQTESDLNNQVSLSPNADDETDTDFHEALPKEILQSKDIQLTTDSQKIKNKTKFKLKQEKTQWKEIVPLNIKNEPSIPANEDKVLVYPVKKEIMKRSPTKYKLTSEIMTEEIDDPQICEEKGNSDKMISKKQTSDSSAHTNQSDSIGSVIPVITISATESDDEILQTKNKTTKGKSKTTKVLSDSQKETEPTEPSKKHNKKSHSELKLLRRQSSVDSINEQKPPQAKKSEEGHKYQYSL